MDAFEVKREVSSDGETSPDPPNPLFIRADSVVIDRNAPQPVWKNCADEAIEKRVRIKEIAVGHGLNALKELQSIILPNVDKFVELRDWQEIISNEFHGALRV
jgi:hypothetical protein